MDAAEKEAGERDCTRALMALTLASDIVNGVRGDAAGARARADWEADCEALLRAVGSEMTGKQVSDAVRELYEGTDAAAGDGGGAGGPGIGVMTAMEMGIDARRAPGEGAAERITRVDADFVLPGATPKDLSAALRNALREDVAELASLPLKRVMIDGVRLVGRGGCAGAAGDAPARDLLVNVKATLVGGGAQGLVDALLPGGVLQRGVGSHPKDHKKRQFFFIPRR